MLTPRRFAEKADLALMTFSRLERGEHDPPHIGTLTQIARGLGAPLFELMSSAGYFEDDADTEPEGERGSTRRRS